jgi:hypothetical protein
MRQRMVLAAALAAWCVLIWRPGTTPRRVLPGHAGRYVDPRLWGVTPPEGVALEIGGKGAKIVRGFWRSARFGAWIGESGGDRPGFRCMVELEAK